MKYYEAYDERYKVIHEKGYSWSSDKPTPIVLNILNKLNINNKDKILEIGCGEGRDSIALLKQGYNLLAIDISKEAIKYCQNLYKEYKSNFKVLDCLKDTLNEQYDSIYAIAVIHMLVIDEDRNKFYNFIYNHLSNKGMAIICSMGDGNIEYCSNINEAYDIQTREHISGKVNVAATSCRMVSFKTMEKEIKSNHLDIVEKGITESLPDFNSLMYVVVKKHDGK